MTSPESGKCPTCGGHRDHAPDSCPEGTKEINEEPSKEKTHKKQTVEGALSSQGFSIEWKAEGGTKFDGFAAVRIAPEGKLIKQEDGRECGKLIELDDLLVIIPRREAKKDIEELANRLREQGKRVEVRSSLKNIKEAIKSMYSPTSNQVF